MAVPLYGNGNQPGPHLKWNSTPSRPPEPRAFIVPSHETPVGCDALGVQFVSHCPDIIPESPFQVTSPSNGPAPVMRPPPHVVFTTRRWKVTGPATSPVNSVKPGTSDKWHWPPGVARISPGRALDTRTIIPLMDCSWAPASVSAETWIAAGAAKRVFWHASATAPAASAPIRLTGLIRASLVMVHFAAPGTSPPVRVTRRLVAVRERPEQL